MEQPLPMSPGGAPPPTWSDLPGPGGAFGAGALIGRSFRTWARHALLYALVGGVASVPMAVAMYRLYVRFPAVADPGRAEEFLAQLPALLGSFAAGWMIALVTTSLTMAAVCQAAAQTLGGEPVRVAAMASAAIHRAPYVLALILIGMLGAIVTACTIVGPFFLMVAWCAAVPATVVERAGPIRALGRSWELSRGHRWPLFAGFAVIMLCLLAAGGIVQGATTATLLAVSGPQALEPGPALALPVAIQQVLAGMLGTLTTVSLAVAHHGLRAVKEGGDPATLARVFE